MIAEKELQSYKETVRDICYLVHTFYLDVEPLLKEYNIKNFMDAFYYVKKLSYVADPKKLEQITRPSLVMYEALPLYQGKKVYRDCDNKTGLICSFATIFKHPWRIVVAGNGVIDHVTKKKRKITDKEFQTGLLGGEPFPHHIYSDTKLNGIWTPTDATYPDKGGFGQKMKNEVFRETFSMYGNPEKSFK